jgi:hypothetical protein
MTGGTQLIQSSFAKTSEDDSGERGIRTLGTVARTTVFETVPFDRSGISPNFKNKKIKKQP